MEDIVAVEVTTDSGTRCYFLTWGRIQDPVDPEPLEAIVMEHAHRFATPGAPLSTRVCGTLQDAAEAPRFFEYFFGFCQERIPFGRWTYQRWRKRTDAEMRAGKHLAFCGPVKDYSRSAD